MTPLISKWHRELELYCGLKPLLILEGNILDRYRYPVAGSVGENELVPLAQYLHGFFTDMGYGCVAFYSNLIGFANPFDDAMTGTFARLTKTKVTQGAVPSEFKGNQADSAPNCILRAMAQNTVPCVTVLEMAGRYVTNPDRLDQNDTNAFNLLQQAAMSAATVNTKAGRLQNLLVLLVDKVNDLPTWFYLNNPQCRTIKLEVPDREERRRLMTGQAFADFFDGTVYRTQWPYYRDHPEELSALQEKFLGMTEGMTFAELDAIRRLAKRECVSIRELCSMVDLYKYGIKENPWSTLSMASLKTAKEDFQKRIKGQDAALERTLDVVKRAVTGMNGISSSNSAKPKGVLFFAGPTGVGKTETAKALAEKLFGDESLCIRFDMSEYGQSHSDQKLMGAPPGYVGYEAGGQLTNAVKKNPFAILLFDEIEKAHTNILDKFLQILEDGRMTDGQGNTVYFSECVIIFTSNLGMYVKDAFGKRQPNVTMDMPYEEVRKAIRSAIEDYFKLELGRPELLNRIGENIVVFDFIRREAGEAILKSQVKKLISRLAEQKNITVRIEDFAYNSLQEAALFDLSNGGRGIGNQVEALLINPLSRYLFNHEILSDASLVIEGFDVTANPPDIRCRREENTP